MDEIKREDTLSKFELLNLFQNFVSKSKFLIIEFKDLKDSLNNFYSLIIEKENYFTELIFNIRNIGDAYLPNKPQIKRRQVGKLDFDKLPLNEKKKISLLVGIKLINNEPVLVCWNPFFFVGHQTNRSCYVLESTMNKGLQLGFYTSEDCKTKVYVCNENNFDKLLSYYIEENTID